MAPTTIPRGGGRSPPPLGMVAGAAGAAQTQKSTISGRPQKHVFKTQVYAFIVFAAADVIKPYKFTGSRWSAIWDQVSVPAPHSACTGSTSVPPRCHERGDGGLSAGFLPIREARHMAATARSMGLSWQAIGGLHGYSLVASRGFAAFFHSFYTLVAGWSFSTQAVSRHRAQSLYRHLHPA